MKRINAYIDETMFDRLKGLSGTLSEHLRTAISEYLQKKLHEIDISVSKSQRKEDK